ncbi:N-acetyltransferase B complex non catalytic subunit-domain-containing protein [Lophiotrema nucula]|uniref:N-acetyltransferase B complex non catalytic subunit-domain-containing protein n=1 Tax=Lophiotrema nucula TaxID=690887 RepID=A0A6A5YSB7_9PLEO|nr:N-acetyltransferase B complex non catalytic subunit-domain-containing protein [Lophiotrema nucula]
MALNWEKYEKLKGDYRIPKFALAENTRQLKKRPNDPWLSLWKGEIQLQLNNPPNAVVKDILLPICKRQPPMNDLALLTTHYSLLIDATRRSKLHVSYIASVGNECIQAWQNAAKTCRTPKDRFEVWNALFVAALREDCWEDVRYAIQQASQEKPKNEKTVKFALILANQLAADKAEADLDPAQPPSITAKLQRTVAYSWLKKAWGNVSHAPKDPLRIEDMRDLRFMFKIFEKQGRIEELDQLLSKDVPESISGMVLPNLLEFRLEILDYLAEKGEWSKVWDRAITDTAIASKENGVNEEGTIFELQLASTVKWWSFVLEALSKNFTDDDARSSARQQLQNFLESLLQSYPGRRELHVAQLLLTKATTTDGSAVLDLCKAYWQKNSRRSACFDDLRRFVESLSTDQRKDFYSYITKTTERDRSPHVKAEPEKSKGDWLQAEANVLKFAYILTLSSSDGEEPAVTETFVTNALRLLAIASMNKDEVHFEIGTLAVIGLLHLHHRKVIRPQPSDSQVQHVHESHRLLLQAGLLLMYLTTGEAGKLNRPLLLLSTRTHLFLGLGRIAFDDYRFARVKEMLKDTVSYILLTDISQAHPFDAAGHNAFSAADELRDIINSMRKMERKTGEFLYSDLQDFFYDQALGLLDIQGKLRTSITKHSAFLELRRLHRIKGEQFDAKYDLTLQEFGELVDSRDKVVLPHYGPSLEPLLKPDGWPEASNVYDRHLTNERPLRLLYKDPFSAHIDARIKAHGKAQAQKHGDISLNPVERLLRKQWELIGAITEVICAGPLTKIDTDLITSFKDLLKDVDRETNEIQHLIGTLDDSQQDLLPYERGLQYFYGHIEVLQAIIRVVDTTREHLKKPSLPAKEKNKLPKQVLDDLEKLVKTQFSTIQDNGDHRIAALRRDGRKMIRDAGRFGPTGEALKAVLSDEDLQGYCGEYVDAAIEALKGVGKVKLK